MVVGNADTNRVVESATPTIAVPFAVSNVFGATPGHIDQCSDAIIWFVFVELPVSRVDDRSKR